MQKASAVRSALRTRRYIVTYTAGENEDTREWTVFVMDTDICTYLYGFCAPPDTAADMGETYQNIFSQLYLSDEE